MISIMKNKKQTPSLSLKEINSIKNQERITKNKLTRTNLIVLLLGIYVLLSVVIIEIFYSSTTDISGAANNLVETIDGKNYIVKDNLLTLIFGAFQPWIFFTTISNVFVGIMMIFIALFSSKKLQRIFFVSVVYILITFIIFWTLISYTLDFDKTFETFGSINNHFISSVLAFIAYFLVRKRILSITNRTIYYSSIGILAYFFFALILFYSNTSLVKFATAEKYGTEFANSGAIIYSFLNFNAPFFTSGSNVGLTVFLDILAFMLAFWIPIGLGYLVKWMYRTEITKYKFKSFLTPEKYLTIKDLA